MRERESSWLCGPALIDIYISSFVWFIFIRLAMPNASWAPPLDYLTFLNATSSSSSTTSSLLSSSWLHSSCSSVLSSWPTYLFGLLFLLVLVSCCSMLEQRALLVHSQLEVQRIAQNPHSFSTTWLINIGPLMSGSNGVHSTCIQVNLPDRLPKSRSINQPQCSWRYLQQSSFAGCLINDVIGRSFP